MLVSALIAIYETSLGIQQVMGVKSSGNINYAITGSFSNPGPYGGLIAVVLSILIAYLWLYRRNADRWYEKGIWWLSLFSAVLCVIVLPASMSRAAWLSCGVAVLVLGFKEMNVGLWIRNNKFYSCVLVAAVVAMSAGAFFMKKDSAIGRFHIWHMELRAIADQPWTGHGHGTVLGAYGDAQAEYFAEKERSETIVRVAGCPEYAFNEYLKIGVEYGIPPMVGVIVVMIALIALLLKYRSPFAYGLIAFSVFAFFSYPLEAIHIKSEAEKKWESIRYLSGMELYEDAVEELAPLYGDLKDNYRYIYDYGYALHKCNRYQESNEILKEGAKISSDPMFYNIIGKNQEAMGLYEEAEKAYLHAHHMVPYRLYPLTLLMKMKIRLQDTDQALIYARKIVSMPVNERHMTMVRLQNEAKECVDSLSIIVSD